MLYSLVKLPFFAAAYGKKVIRNYVAFWVCGCGPETRGQSPQEPDLLQAKLLKLFRPRYRKYNDRRGVSLLRCVMLACGKMHRYVERAPSESCGLAG